MSKQIRKEDILYLHFHKKQRFNKRPINKLDKYGKPIVLESLGFPYQSQFKDCYISVNSAFIQDDKFHPERNQITILANAPIKVYRYDGSNAKLITTLLGKDVVKEFNSWQTQKVKEKSTGKINKQK